MKKFLMYCGRWQLSSITLAPIIYLIPDNAILAAIVGNIVGACIFWWIDKYLIFNSEQRN